ncbi:cell wall-active antibiotics response protein LiaF [Halalkalibacterium halodurans]|uniref:cell wall-active antibiotics response protein LiaF n=1 Tax=Halalkalibacterium halodurans TaxID=86665 RepID=UPI002E1BD4B6|nr:cell wall-active antibiotics response protein LiaF [Halalkalibacterium halodurans]MED4085467.1 cell wall-active antibiotics response protein LiaF [Halalkalibacterium halodurans]MED4104409.1 cell wall-active antibiotics response protein LiaF [Halalkalibacterium halodurans]MED4108086.1 cell wall-active antibiotics response protein LiaF [Halalkalibacterium halodurans]MED4147715.1 cell wall-active antibiotics response protein LiaF [Halalkalibacterium halodurans]
MKKQTLFGFIIVIIGLLVVLQALRFSVNIFLAPIVFSAIGYFFYTRSHRFLAIVFFIIAATILFDRLYSFNFIGLLIAALFIYYGYKMMKTSDRKKERKGREKRKATQRKDKEETNAQAYFEAEGQEFQPTDVESTKKGRSKEDIIVTTSSRRSFIGDIHYVYDPFELDDFTIWNGIGEVKIDFSKAMIPEGETVIIIQQLIGEINLFVPEDLAVSVQGTSWIGDVSLFQRRQGGFFQTLSVATKDYKQSPRRIKLVLSTVIGEVKVRAV